MLHTVISPSKMTDDQNSENMSVDDTDTVNVKFSVELVMILQVFACKIM